MCIVIIANESLGSPKDFDVMSEFLVSARHFPGTRRRRRTTEGEPELAVLSSEGESVIRYSRHGHSSSVGHSLFTVMIIIDFRFSLPA